MPKPATAVGGAAEIARVPVVHERVSVDKHIHETGQVVVHIEPHLKRETVDVSLLDEQVQVERVPINRRVVEASPTRQEGDVTIVPVYEEVLVIEKRLMLKEEIHIRRRHQQRREQRDVEVRTEEARVLRAKNEAD
jgi:uncharacterized protein (TIGR02271 family)